VTVVVEAQPATSRQLADAAAVPVVRRESLDGLTDFLRADRSHNVVIVGPSVPGQAATELTARLRVVRPELGVIVVRRSTDRAFLAEAMRAGVRDVLTLDDAVGIGEAVTRLHEQAAAILARSDPAHSSGGRLITVFSAKGGCGKTTLSTSLAALLAAREATSVVLVDLDLAFGDVAISLQLFPTHTIGDAVMMSESLDNEGLNKLLTRHRSGVQVLAAPISPETKETISPRLVARVLSLLKAEYDFVIVDSSPNFDDHVLAALDNTDTLLMLVVPDIPALKNLKVAMETLKLLRFPTEKVKTVVNQSDLDAGLSLRDIARTADVEVAAAIPSSVEVTAATNRGEILAVHDPSHPVATAMRQLLESEVLDRSAPDAAEHPTRRGRLPWWRKRRRAS
jgi:pilus assembly protein CpaE